MLFGSFFYRVFPSASNDCIHMTEISKIPPGKFISTREAASRLGVALSTVQAWVESGILPAWKTAGGHRRIPTSSIEAVHLRQQSILNTVSPPETLKVLVVEDDPVQLEVYQRHFREWQLDVRLYTATNGFDGLILIGRHSPDLIITDLAMPEMDGFSRRVPASGGKDCSPSLVSNRASTVTVIACGGPGRPRRSKSTLLALG